MLFTEGCMWYRRAMVDRVAAPQPLSMRVSEWKRSRDSEENMLTCPYMHECVCVYIKVSEGNIDTLYSEHMEQQERGLGCCISSSVLHWDDLSQHTVTLTPPLSICWNHSFYWTAANQKRRMPLSLQSKLKIGATTRSYGLQVGLKLQVLQYKK